MRSTASDIRILLTLVFISLFIFLLDSLNIFNLPKSAVAYLTSPVQLGIYRFGQSFNTQYQFLIAARRASQENIALKQQLGGVLMENSNLRTQVTDLQSMIAQNQALDPQTFHTTPARVIGFDRYLMIDKGSDDGLKLDQTVVYKDAYVGVIKNLSPKKAAVMLASDPDSKIFSIATNQAGKAQGILVGQFGNQLLLDKVLHQEPLSPGDLLYTSGTDSHLLKGLVLGTVSEVMDKDNEVFKQAKVRPIFESSDLDTVFILTD